MYLLKTGARRLAVTLAGMVACVLVLSGMGASLTAASAAASPSPSPVPASVSNSSTQAQGFAYFNSRLPLLRQALAAGETLPQALQQAGFPPLQITITGRNGTGTNVISRGPSCQGLTCGWKFSAATTYEMEYLVWVGTIAGPAGICLLFGTPTAGIACALASGIYSVISAYAFPVPKSTGKCLYAGIGAGTVVKLEKC